LPKKGLRDEWCNPMGQRVTISHNFELDCIICGRLEKKTVQILHERMLERAYCEDPIGKVEVQ